MSANERQVGGTHYQEEGEQHWDRIWRKYGRGYFVGNITKYVERYHEKNGIQDLEKAIHYTQKLIELEAAEERKNTAAQSHALDAGRYGFTNLNQGIVKKLEQTDRDKLEQALEELSAHHRQRSQEYYWRDGDDGGHETLYTEAPTGANQLADGQSVPGAEPGAGYVNQD